MKWFKYITYALVAGAIFASCEREDTEFIISENIDSDIAKIQITRVIPEADYTAAATNNRFYKMEIDGKEMWGDDYIIWARMGTVPSVSYYYMVSPGQHNLKCYYKRNDEYILAYDQNFNVTAGQRASLFIYDYNKEPLIVDNTPQYEFFPDAGQPDVAYVEDPNDPKNASRFQMLRFVNIMFEKGNVAGDYKLQYMYQDPYDLTWKEVGTPIGFGESTDWCKIPINIYAPSRSGQSGTGTARNVAENRTGRSIVAGACTIYYRVKMISASGADLGYMTYTFNSGRTNPEYKDYWTATTGCYFFHVMRGCRVAAGNQNYDGCYVTQIAKY